MYADIFVRERGRGGGRDFICLYYSLISSVQRAQVPRSSVSPDPSHVHHGIEQNPMDFFPHLEGREENSQGKQKCYGYLTIF